MFSRLSLIETRTPLQVRRLVKGISLPRSSAGRTFWAPVNGRSEVEKEDMNAIYVYRNNQPIGPFASEMVLEMLRRGRLSPDAPAIRQGQREWRPLRELFGPPAAQTPPPAPSGPAVASGSKRPAARKSLRWKTLLAAALARCFSAARAARPDSAGAKNRRRKKM